jgi:hypothetical protein
VINRTGHRRLLVRRIPRNVMLTEPVEKHRGPKAAKTLPREAVWSTRRVEIRE